MTQGTLGAALPQTVAPPRDAGVAMLCGFAAGMAPDLDVLIRSSSDPLLFLEYHRQFTHSLVFIPLGAAIVALALWGVFGQRRGWALGKLYIYAFLGYATHALLDACTSYGTLLFWPFSEVRVAWNSVSIIDPLFTLPLLIGVLWSRFSRRRRPAFIALGWGLLYLVAGVIARDAAAEAGMELARARGHAPLSVEAKPSFANLLLWKTVYREGGSYFVDAVRLGAEPRIYEGDSVPALDSARDLPWLEGDSLQALDVERFRWFSQGYIALDPEHPRRVIDLRYSMLPNEIRPLWSIELSPELQASAHVSYQTHRERGGGSLHKFWLMLRGLPLSD